MLINDSHRFVFIHIPKCAGTLVRTRLQPLNKKSERSVPRIEHHPTAGLLDTAHIPLFTLRDHFPDELSLIRRYWSFAVVRDPLARFASSVSQRFYMHSNFPIHQRSFEEITTSIDEIIAYLGAQPQIGNRLPPEFIHFQRQIDFIELEGERLVNYVFPITRLDYLFEVLSAKTGLVLVPPVVAEEKSENANASRVYRNESLRILARMIRPMTIGMNKLLPARIVRPIYDKATVPRDSRLRAIFSSKSVKEFVDDYYAEDIQVYRNAINELGRE